MLRVQRRIAVIASAILVFFSLSVPSVASAENSDPGDEPMLSQQIAPQAVEGNPSSVYRFYSPTFRGHFYTADPTERDKIIQQWSRDWTFEGERYAAFLTQSPGTVPLYRFWSDRYKGHFYTADEAEKDFVLANWSGTWSFEGIAYYVYPAGSNAADSIPMFRFWGPGVQHHFYTASASERDTVISRWPQTWTYESERFRVPRGDLAVEPTPTRPTDKDCGDFATWPEAQAFFGQYYAYYGDIANLDSDGDLVACELLPGHP